MSHRFQGRVNRLYVQGGDGNSPEEGHCYIRLAGVSVGNDDLFDLRQSHINYNALFSLALSAAVNRDVLQVRTIGEVESVPTGKYPDVSYLVIDW